MLLTALPFVYISMTCVDGSINFIGRNLKRISSSVVGCSISTIVFTSLHPVEIATAISEESLTTRQRIIRGTESFLTNPVLETMRKIDQSDPDDNKYANKAILLIPVVSLSRDIQSVQNSLKTLNELDSDSARNSLMKSKFMLDDDRFSKISFKKTFNKYADNIYYSDPERANLYLGGGAMPNSMQTQQYLVRNSILTKVDDLKEDINTLLAKPNILDDKQIIADAVDDARETFESFELYFSYVDENELRLANLALDAK